MIENQLIIANYIALKTYKKTLKNKTKLKNKKKKNKQCPKKLTKIFIKNKWTGAGKNTTKFIK